MNSKVTGEEGAAADDDDDYVKKNVWKSDKSWEPGTHSHSPTLSFSLSQSLTLDMLNKFCFHLYAQKSLFIAENCNAFFLDSSITLSTDIRVSRAGSQLKIKKIRALLL